jgi:hypothetical protein
VRAAARRKLIGASLTIGDAAILVIAAFAR